VELPLAIIGVAIGVVILPKLSGDHVKTQAKAFSDTLDWGVRIGILVALPSMIGLILLAKPILATVYRNGVNDWSLVEMGSMSLTTYSFGLPAFILVKILAPGFYSRQDTKTPVRIGIIAMLSNIIMSGLIVFPWYKLGFVGPHAGLALSTALAGYINAGMLFYQLRKQKIYRHNESSRKAWIRDLARIVAGIAVMIMIITLVNPEDEWWQMANLQAKIIKLFTLVSLAIIGYFTVLYLSGFRKKDLII